MYGLKFGDELSESTRKELESFLSAFRAWVSVEHNEDGTHHLGTWTDVPFNAGNFTASGAMTWTLTRSDVDDFSYTLLGSTMTVNFAFSSTTVAGTPSTTLQIAIPGGYTAARPVNATVHLNDNGTHMTAGASTSKGYPVIYIAKVDFANFTAATNATGVYGQITFEVQ